MADLPSKRFLTNITRLLETGHPERLTESLQDAGLMANVPTTWVAVGDRQHPTLSFKDLLACLSENGKLDLLFCGHDGPAYADFWGKFQKLEPRHPLYTTHAARLSDCVPCLVHCDEGTSQKKKGLMVMGLSPLLGRGTSMGGPGLNYVGTSLTTRFLFSCMQTKLYNKTPAILSQLAKRWAVELQELFEHGTEVTQNGRSQRLFIITVGMKGDWPALTKFGNLSRHHGRQTRGGKPKDGICHLCMGGIDGFEWHDYTFANMQRMHNAATLPWRTPSPFTQLIPHSQDCSASWYKIDIFHAFHKGILGDIAANGIEACARTTYLLFFQW